MDYYLLIGGLKKGPFGFEELLQNGLTADVLVWHVGMTDWRKASEMEELGELLAQLPPPPPNTSVASPSVPPIHFFKDRFGKSTHQDSNYVRKRNIA